jgi:hypothetical protein
MRKPAIVFVEAGEGKETPADLMCRLQLNGALLCPLPIVSGE